MSVTQHSAATALLAAPSVQVNPDGQNFTTTQRGYHKGEVDDFVRWARDELDKARAEAARLAGQVIPFIGREASSPEGQKLLAELIQIAADEITGKQAAVAVEIEQMITGAHQQSDSIIADAREQAQKITASATQQAASLLGNARTDAKKTTDDAAAHAAAVHETAEERLRQLVKIHEDGLARLAQVNQVTTQVLDAEKARGPLASEVDKALAAVRR
jgi:cell division septum initiation protein DivIVA